MATTWREWNTDMTPLARDILALSKSRMEKEDSVCSDYSLSDIDDGLDGPETNGEVSYTSTSKSLPNTADVKFSLFNFDDDFPRSFSLAAEKGDRSWSDSSGISLQDSPISTIAQSPRNSYVFSSPRKSPAISALSADQNMSESTSAAWSNPANSAENYGIKTMMNTFENGRTISNGGRATFSPHSSEQGAVKENSADGTGVVPVPVIEPRKGSNLSRKRSMSQGNMHDRKNSASSDKNNNNNEINSKTLPKPLTNRMTGQPNSAQWKLYNRAMETYRKSAEKKEAERVKSVSDPSNEAAYKTASQRTSLPLSEDSLVHLSTGMPSLQRSSAVLSFSGQSMSAGEKSPTGQPKPNPTFAPIGPPEQEQRNSPLHNDLDYKTILRRTRSKVTRGLVNPVVLEEIQDDAYLDIEVPDPVTDIDSFLCLKKSSETKNCTAKDNVGDKTQTGAIITPRLGPPRTVRTPRSPERIVWSGLKLLADKKKISQQSAKGNILTKLQKMSLKQSGIYIFGDQDKKENNLRKNAIITKRNKSMSHHPERYIYLDPASHNGCNMTSSFGQYHTVASPARLSRISCMRRPSLSDYKTTVPVPRQFWKKKTSQTANISSPKRSENFLKSSSVVLDGRGSEHVDEFFNMDSQLGRRYSKSSSDLTDCHEKDVRTKNGFLNTCTNNNNSQSQSARSSPKRSSLRRGRKVKIDRRPSKLVIDLESGTCDIKQERKVALHNSTAIHSGFKSPRPRILDNDSSKLEEKKPDSTNLPVVKEITILPTDKKTYSQPTEGEYVTFKETPKSVDRTLSKSSYQYSVDPFDGIFSEDMSKLDLNIEEYFSFLSGNSKSNITTPEVENSTNLSVQDAILSIESDIKEMVPMEYNTPSQSLANMSPSKVNGTVKRRRRRRRRRSGIPSYVPDYVKPAYAGNTKRSSACYQLNVSSKTTTDEETLRSMASFISKPSVQKCKRNSFIGNVKTWSGRVSDRTKTKSKSKFGSLSIARILKSNKLKLSIAPVSQNHVSNVPNNSHSTAPLQIAATNISGGLMHEETKKEKKKKKGKKGKLTKADISTPQDFKHVGHVGWDPNKGFDMNKVDPALKDLFTQAGVSTSQLEDKDTAQFIYDFIERRGGVDAVKNHLSGPPPPPPSRGPRDSAPPAPPSRRNGGPPPAPPARNGGPPPPPPNRRSEPPPPPPTHKGGRSAPPPPPSHMPPPPMGAPPPPAPPPPPVAPPPPSMGDGRGALLDQIRGGSALKSSSDRPAPEPAASGQGALLAQIRQGMQLKTVSEDDLRRGPSEEEDDGGIAGALARALMQREKAIHDSDSESDDGEFNDDDDWDD